MDFSAGLLASLVVTGFGFQGQAFDAPGTSAAIIQTLPFDMDQVNLVELRQEVNDMKKRLEELEAKAR